MPPQRGAQDKNAQTALVWSMTLHHRLIWSPCSTTSGSLMTAGLRKHSWIDTADAIFDELKNSLVQSYFTHLQRESKLLRSNYWRTPVMTSILFAGWFLKVRMPQLQHRKKYKQLIGTMARLKFTLLTFGLKTPPTFVWLLFQMT